MEHSDVSNVYLPLHTQETLFDICQAYRTVCVCLSCQFIIKNCYVLDAVASWLGSTESADMQRDAIRYFELANVDLSRL